jgi:hypothetical protein
MSCLNLNFKNSGNNQADMRNAFFSIQHFFLMEWKEEMFVRFTITLKSGKKN